MRVAREMALREARKLNGNEAAMLRYMGRYGNVKYVYTDYERTVSDYNDSAAAELCSFGFVPLTTRWPGIAGDKTLVAALEVLDKLELLGLVQTVVEEEKYPGRTEGWKVLSDRGKAVYSAYLSIVKDETGILEELVRNDPDSQSLREAFRAFPAA